LTCSSEHSKHRKARLDRERRGAGAADEPRRRGRPPKRITRPLSDTRSSEAMPAPNIFDQLAAFAELVPQGWTVTIDGPVITARRDALKETVP
jgi:hypothetical protein